MKSYVPKALSDLRKQGEHVAGDNFKKYTYTLLGLLKQSSLFILPEKGEIFDKDTLKAARPEELVLPYPVTAIQFDMGDSVDEQELSKKGLASVPKRLMLLIDLRENPDLLALTLDLCPRSLVSLTEDHWLLWPFNYSSGRWLYNWCGVALQIEGTFNVNKDGGIVSSPLGMVALPELGTLAMEHIKRRYWCSGEELQKRLMESAEMDTGLEIISLYHLLTALELKNTEVQVHKEVGIGKNLRTKKPIQVQAEYRTLKVYSTPKGEQGTGTHSSPRPHARRAHWRNLPTGERIKVRACIVNASGPGVLKDYRVTTWRSKT